MAYTETYPPYKVVIHLDLDFATIYKKVTDFQSKINCYYFDGNYEKINQLIKENKNLYRKIIRTGKEKYFLEIFNEERINHHDLLINK
jgi:shikimate kinase